MVGVLVSAILLAACARQQPTPTAVKLVPTAIVASVEPEATVPPEQLPTAMPIWTATPTPAPDVTATPSPPEQPTLPPGAAVVVNGQVIAEADLEEHIAQSEIYFVQQPGFDAQSAEGEQAMLALRGQVRDWLIDQVLMRQAATELGITVGEEQVDAEVTKMRGDDAARFEKWLAASGLAYESLREQLRVDLLTAAMRDRVTGQLGRNQEQVHVRHIWLSQAEAAQQVLDELAQGQNFIQAARRFSEDQATADSGGDLGFVPRGVMPPAFEEAAFALKPGEISGIVPTDSGFHIIQLVEVDPERPVPDKLWPTVQQRAFEQWLAERRAAADIQER
jgi:parvulin-like peptidyl-prolyl isomerase